MAVLGSLRFAVLGCEKGRDRLRINQAIDAEWSQNRDQSFTTTQAVVPFGHPGDVTSGGQGLDSKLHPQCDKSHLQVQGSQELCSQDLLC